MYLFSSKKTKVTIEYENQSNIFELFPYDTINNLKDAIINVFPQITFNPVLLLRNKQINDNTLHISDLSKGKGHLQITIVKPSAASIQNSKRNSLDDKGSLIKLNCQCQSPIEHFCSNCREFICFNCKTKHKDHKTYIFDKGSIEDSVKVYAISLQAEISNEMNKYKEIEAMFRDNLLIDFHSWKEMIVRKLDKIETIFKSFEDFEEILQTQCQNVERMGLDTSNKIEKMLIDYTFDGKNNNNNLLLAKDLFNNLSNAEEVIDFLSKENDSRKEEFNTNKKINELFTSLDSVIEEIDKLSHLSYEEICKKTDKPNTIVKAKNKELLSPIRNHNIIKHTNHHCNTHILTSLTHNYDKPNSRQKSDNINRLSFMATRKKLTTPSQLISLGEYNKYFKTETEDDLEKDLAFELMSKRENKDNKHKRKANRDRLKCSVLLPNINHL